MTKRLIPKGFGDYLAIISFIGFLIIFLNSVSAVDLSDYLTSAFLVVSGVGLMNAGRITSIRHWAKDGLQGNEFNWFFTSIFGIFSVVVGILALPQINLITPPLKGIIAVSSILSMSFIAYEYLKE